MNKNEFTKSNKSEIINLSKIIQSYKIFPGFTNFYEFVKAYRDNYTIWNDLAISFKITPKGYLRYCKNSMEIINGFDSINNKKLKHDECRIIDCDVKSCDIIDII